MLSSSILYMTINDYIKQNNLNYFHFIPALREYLCLHTSNFSKGVTFVPYGHNIDMPLSLEKFG